MDEEVLVAKFDFDSIEIPQYRQVLEELVDATDCFRKEGSVAVSLEALALAEAIERMDGDGYVGFFCFFRHIMIMIDVGYHGKGDDIFTSRNLRLYFKDYCRLGVEAKG